MAVADGTSPLELWGGVECTVNRVGDRWTDQTVRTGHQDRCDDLDRFASLGLTALRYPALWERIAPESLDTPDWGWTDARLARMKTLGIRPILGLVHHGSGPRYTGLLDANFPELLARFAGMVAERYPWVSDYTPVNEPLTTARFSALYGLWYPHESNDKSFARALMQQCAGIASAMRAIRVVNPLARLVQTEDCGDISGTAAVRAQVEHEEHRRWLTWDLLTGRVRRGHPLFEYLLACGVESRELRALSDGPCAPDVIGLNYYLTSDRHLDERLERYPVSSHGDNGRVRYADVEAVARARREGIAGHEAHLLAAWERYRIPVAVTEAHLACTREEQARWMLEAWTGAQWARGSGADVRAVTAWALLGSYDWCSLVTRDEGHYEPGVYDVRAVEPRPTFLVPMLRSLAAGELPSHPILDDPGWWRRPNRLLGPADEKTPALKARPVLIMGTHRLAGEFERSCHSRGLAVTTVHDAELEIADEQRLDALCLRLRPWAVVNLTSFGRVDEADGDPDRAGEVFVSGSSGLAEVCRRHGTRLLELSADADARVLKAMPDALIVRTGPRSGSRPGGNFVSRVLESGRAGHRFRAACDAVVSPASDRDLVNGSLDLLIDGERGIWQLANDGVISWHKQSLGCQ